MTIQTTQDSGEALLAMLALPGSGVYTVSHALAEREQLLQQLYGTTDIAQAKSQWQHQLAKLDKASSPWILGIPEDAGGGILRGANWGPLFLRLAYYKQTHAKILTELGDVRVIPQLILDEYVNNDILKSCRTHLYGHSANYPVSPLSIAFEVASLLYQQNASARLLGIGGDHAASYPLIKAKLLAARAMSQRIAVLHFDAHTDLLHDRMGIPITFGSWVSHALPYMSSSDLWIQLGIRQTGHNQAYWQQQVGVKQYWADAWHTEGVAAISDSIIQYLTQRGVDGVYITFDIDALDLSQASATGTPAIKGLVAEDVIVLMKRIRAAFPVVAADLMEFAPMVHHPQLTMQPEPDTTLQHIVPIYGTLIEILSH